MLTLHEFLISYLPDYNIHTCSRACRRYPAGRKRGLNWRTTKCQTRNRQFRCLKESLGHGHGHPHALWLISWSATMTLGRRHHLAQRPLVMCRKLWHQLGPSCSRAWWTPSRQGWCTWQRQSLKNNTWDGRNEGGNQRGVAAATFSESSPAIYVQQRGTAH